MSEHNFFSSLDLIKILDEDELKQAVRLGDVVQSQ